ncbi:unnamed protein product [Phytophthora lilii]|uniref:Unnamed protein product n=1 Tax=Phytophthora lilii TaxID=2077276 RepID=A0A9W6XFN0_9STRA|nr:unnamed protein product [Phytophthora lilii]
MLGVAVEPRFHLDKAYFWLVQSIHVHRDRLPFQHPIAVANVSALIGYVAFRMSNHGVGAIPAGYGYFSDYIRDTITVMLFSPLARTTWPGDSPRQESRAVLC